MKSLEKIYAACELGIPSNEVEKKCNDKDACYSFKLYKEDFFINWEALSKIPENYHKPEIEDSDQMDNYFSNEKLLDEEVIYSSKIEGINLTKEVIKNATEDEKELNHEYKDVYRMAFSYLLDQDKLTHEVLEETKNIFASSKKTNGEMTAKNSRYRNGDVGIYKNVNGIDKEIRKGVNHNEIEKYMDDVFDYFNNYFNKDIDESWKYPIPISGVAAMTHCFFEYVHPYFDGNGRMGRMLLSWFLRKTVAPETSYFLSEVIDNNKSKYYRSLEHSQRTKNLTYHAAFMVTALKESVDIYYKVSYALSKATLSEIQTRFLKKLLISGMYDGKISYPLIKSKFQNQSKQSFFKMIDKLIEKGVVAEERTSKVRYFYFKEPQN